MTRIFLSALCYLLLYVPATTIGASLETVAQPPVQVVAAFQQIPHYEMFCADETRRSTAPIKIAKKFESLFSRELLKLFLWEECGVPETPPHDESSYSGITWDIRFGISSAAIGEDSVIAENIRPQKAKLYGADKATVKILYDFGTLKNLVTTYTLIREDGHWKIDDLAPKGYATEMEELLHSSDSIKTDMQNNYRAAEERYKREQSKKH
jgi:hypothetical protein